jgi:hypothetical protein
MPLTQQQLETHLWKAADILRGRIDAADYKHCIFGLLFFKRLSHRRARVSLRRSCALGYTGVMNLFRRAPRVFPLALALVGLAACNNEEPDPISLDSYVSAFTTEICEAIVACDCEYDHGSAYDHCIAQLSVVFESSSELIQVVGLSFDGVCAQEALDDL